MSRADPLRAAPPPPPPIYFGESITRPSRGARRGRRRRPLLAVVLVALTGLATATAWWLGGAASASPRRAPYVQRVTTDTARVRWMPPDGTPGGGVIWRREGDTAPPAIAPGRRVGWTYAADLEGLEPATRYEYAVLAPDQIDLAAPPRALPASGRKVFQTAPRPGDDVPVRIWVLGDSGKPGRTQRHVRNAAERAGARAADFLLFLGDNAYWSGSHDEYQAGFFSPYRGSLASRNAFAVFGNHDARLAEPHIQSGAIFDLLDPPTAGEFAGVPSNWASYYSVTWGPLHLVVLDSETEHRPVRERMLAWLREDLAAAGARGDIRWIVAAFHHPPYCKTNHDSDANPNGSSWFARTQLVPLLEAGGADLILAGHSHIYARSHLIDGHHAQSVMWSAAAHVRDAGRGGVYHKPAGITPHTGAMHVIVGSSSKVFDGALVEHPALARTLIEAGSLLLDADGDRLVGRFVGASGDVLDRFEIAKRGDATASVPSASVPSAAPVAAP